MKLWESILDRRLRAMTSILGEISLGLYPGISTMEPILVLRPVVEKHRPVNRGLHLGFVDLDKAQDTVPRPKL